ncbi:MAG: DUF5132 domain-containing protein [Prochloraceae cyanobacterium]
MMSQENQIKETIVRSTALARLKQMYQKNPTQTIAIGLGVVVLTPVVLPLLKPVAKATIKSGVGLFEKTKGAIAEAGEVIGDIVAEAKAEVAEERAEKASLKAGLLADRAETSQES